MYKGACVSKPTPQDSCSSATSGSHRLYRRHSTAAQICCLRAAAAKAFTTVLAGLAFTFLISPKISLVQAFVAGLTLVLMRQRPGMVKMPVFFTSFAAMSPRVLRIAEHSLFFMLCSVAIAVIKAPLVIGPPLFLAFMLFMLFMAFIAFIAFMGAMMSRMPSGAAFCKDV